jgi:DNA-binding Lrp family transcriptional regulator
MDDIDKKFLSMIQSDFPLTRRPYRDLGNQLGCSEEELFRRIRRLKREGIIRRIGGNFDSKRLGFTTTLCAAKVPQTKILRFIEVVNKYPAVTHNYLRDHAYNIWFTLVIHNVQEVNRVINEIARATEVREVINLPAMRIFKLLVDFDLT